MEDDRKPIFARNEGIFPAIHCDIDGHLIRGEMWFEEQRWQHDQIGKSCVLHAMGSSVEMRFLISYAKGNLTPPFYRLCLEHIQGLLYEKLGQNEVTPYKLIDLIPKFLKSKGLIDVDDFTLPLGVRGENNWQIPIPKGVPRYKILDDKWVRLNQHDPEHNRRLIVEAIKEGPFYASFYIPDVDAYNENDGYPHYGGDRSSGFHAVMIVGYGDYLETQGKTGQFFTYLNSYGNTWGDGGYGRIYADDVAINKIVRIWISNSSKDPIWCLHF